MSKYSVRQKLKSDKAHQGRKKGTPFCRAFCFTSGHSPDVGRVGEAAQVSWYFPVYRCREALSVPLSEGCSASAEGALSWKRETECEDQLSKMSKVE